MSRQRLNWLTLLSIEKEMLNEIDYKYIINNFASKKARKVTTRKLAHSDG